MSTGVPLSSTYENMNTFTLNLTTSHFITDATEDLPYAIPWVLVALYTTVSLLMMGGNSLVIAAVARFQFLQTPTNLFVAGLACFDFSFAFFGWSMVLQLIRPTLLQGYFTCLVRTAFGVINGLSSSMMLAAIAVERYLGVFWPLRYKQWLTPARIRLIFLLCLAYPFFIVATLTATVFKYEVTLPCSYFTTYPTWAMAIMSGHVIISVLIMITVYLLIIKTTIRLQKQVVNLTPNQTPNLTQSTSFKNNLRALKNLAIVMGLFIVSWMPFLVLTMIQSSDPAYYANHYTMHTLQRILFGLFLVNSIVNPIIYGVRFRGFNVALRLMLGCISEDGRHAALESVTSA